MKENIERIQDITQHIIESHTHSVLPGVFDSIQRAIDRIDLSWSQSFIGYHATAYYKGFKQPPDGEQFDIELGYESSSSEMWPQMTYNKVYNQILQWAATPDMPRIKAEIGEHKKIFGSSKDELKTILEIRLSEKGDQFLENVLTELNKIVLPVKHAVVEAMLPNKVLSYDATAVLQGRKIPHHKEILAELIVDKTIYAKIEELNKLCRKMLFYFDNKPNYMTDAKKHIGDKIFIGHGRSHVWQELKIFLMEKLQLKCEEFNQDIVAGKTTIERLNSMLDNSQFAFLVMTAEDQHADNSKHARENVIHEIGLFQGRLGFNKAIILLEEGCSEFSNIVGLGQIRFPKENLAAKFEEIRDVLKREGLL